jgi:hypothetical protein
MRTAARSPGSSAGLPLRRPRTRSLLSRTMTGCRPPFPRAALRVARQSGMGRRRSAFPFQSIARSTGAPRVWFSTGSLRFLHSGPGLHLHPCAPRLRQPYGDSLLRGTRSVLAVTHVLDFFAHVFTGFAGGRFLLGCAFPCSFLRHDYSPPPPPRNVFSSVLSSQ